MKKPDLFQFVDDAESYLTDKTLYRQIKPPFYKVVIPGDSDVLVKLYKKIKEQLDDHTIPRLNHSIVDWDPALGDPTTIKYTKVCGVGVKLDEDGQPIPEPFENPWTPPDFCLAKWQDAESLRYYPLRNAMHWVSCKSGASGKVMEEWREFRKVAEIAGEQIQHIRSPESVKEFLKCPNHAERWLLFLHDYLAVPRLIFPHMRDDNDERFHEEIILHGVSMTPNAVSKSTIGNVLVLSSVAISHLLETAKFDGHNVAPKRPSGKIPKKPAEKREWKNWIIGVCEMVNADKNGAKSCWNNNKKEILDAGVLGPDEFQRLHKQYRGYPKK